MASAAQIAANRANAQKSTGPRTVEGKQRSRMSALRHGLTAQTLVLPHEEPLAYGQMRESLYEQYQPATPQECMLVDQLVAAWWRTIRVRQIETDMLDMQIQTLNRAYPDKQKSKSTDRQALALRFVTESEKEDFVNFMRYDAAIERAFYRALNNLEKLQAARRKQEIGFVSHPGTKLQAGLSRETPPSSTEPRAPTEQRLVSNPVANQAYRQASGQAPIIPMLHDEIGFVSHPIEIALAPSTNTPPPLKEPRP